MAKAKLFQYAILKHPKNNSKNENEGNTTVLVSPTTILATDEKTAAMKVAKQIPDNEMDNLEQLEIVLQPF